MTPQMAAAAARCKLLIATIATMAALSALLLASLLAVPTSCSRPPGDRSPRFVAAAIKPEVDAGSQPASPSEADNDELLARTYERLVLEGSRVSLGCPHYAEAGGGAYSRPGETIESQTAAAAPEHLGAPNTISAKEQQQFASSGRLGHPGKNPSKNSLQVRWFRNHVPLMNVNRRHHQLEERADEPCACATAAAGGADDLLELGYSEQTTELLEFEELNQTTGVGEGAEPWRQQQHQRRRRQANNNHDSLTSAQNVNELGGRKWDRQRQLAPKDEGDVWCVNEFGELVVNKVSRKLAGKYTCLVAGRESEILLDVLGIAGDEEGREDRGHRDAVDSGQETIDERNSSEDGSTAAVPSSPATATKTPIDRPQVSRVHLDRTGSGQFNGRTQQLNDLADSKWSSQATNSVPQPRDDDELGLAPDEPPADGSRAANNNSSIELNSIKTGRGGPDHSSADGLNSPGGGSRLAMEPGAHLPDKWNMILGDFGEAENGNGAMADAKYNKIFPFDHKQQQQRRRMDAKLLGRRRPHPVHLVKAETISPDDLRLVPGFLYTKQQLYCPIERLFADNYTLHHQNQLLYPLVRALCPSDKSKPTTSGGDFGEQLKRLKMKCYQVARELILSLVSLEGASSQSLESLLEVRWFKDGRQLEFGPNGRIAKGKNINLKLIDFIDQFASDSFAGRGCNNEAALSPACNQTQLKQLLGVRPEMGANISSRIDSVRPTSLRGRTLQLDGVRRDEAGHYTCALRLSGSKLNNKIRHLQLQLRRQQRLSRGGGRRRRRHSSGSNNFFAPDRPIKWTRQRRQLDPASSNDKSHCDETGPFSCRRAAQIDGIRAANGQRRPAKGLDQGQTIRFTPGQESTQGQENLAEKANEPLNAISENNGLSGLGRRLKLLKSILAGELGPELALNYLSEALAGLPSPLAAIQTFSVQVTERAANSSDFWSAITRAEMAYQRRKLADFRRLKRESLINNRRPEDDYSSPPSKVDPGRLVAPSSIVSTENEQTMDNGQVERQNYEAHPKYPASKQSGDSSDNLSIVIGGPGGDATLGRASRSLKGTLNYVNETINVSDETQTESASSNSVANESGNEFDGSIQYQAEHEDSFSETKDLITEANNSQRFNKEQLPNRWTPTVIHDQRENDPQKPSKAYKHQRGEQNKLAAASSAASVENKSFDAGSQLNDEIGAVANSHTWDINIDDGQVSRYYDDDNRRQSIIKSNTETSTSTRAEREQVLKSEANIGSDSFKKVNSDIDNFYDEKLDGNLMWTASQYLYMHVKALTSSTLFGAEVDVEWSNERNDSTTNGIVGTMNLGQPIHQQQQQQLQTITAPFATIDVIFGQNLQLDCTAQALGRLPEVKWYKKIHSVPKIAEMYSGELARTIGSELYWPLTELDLLESEADFRSRKFVCSESTTIFDNLVNQTFTVINRLQLSQFNDRADRDGNEVGHSGENNLYACIVDADIRHTYVTLGVSFRNGPNANLPLDLGKRLLKARSIIRMQTEKSPIKLSGNKLAPEAYNSYDLFKESPLELVPLENWIPIKNSSFEHVKSIDSNNFIVADYKMTPTMLSVIILFVSSSLLALIYLTLHSYKTLMQLQLDEELEDHLVEVVPPTTTCSANHHLATTIGINLKDNMAQSTRDITSCACLMPNESGFNSIDDEELGDCFDAHTRLSDCDCLVDPNETGSYPSKTKIYHNMLIKQHFNYQASSPKVSLYHDQSSDCCEPKMTQLNEDRCLAFKVNMVENPLDVYEQRPDQRTLTIEDECHV